VNVEVLSGFVRAHEFAQHGRSAKQFGPQDTVQNRLLGIELYILEKRVIGYAETVILKRPQRNNKQRYTDAVSA
jgi:hypothetical protein